MNKTPKETLELTKQLEDAMRRSKGKAVFVGLPSEKIGGQIYSNDVDGTTILLSLIHI